jgi:hypothetical protein
LPAPAWQCTPPTGDRCLVEAEPEVIARLAIASDVVLREREVLTLVARDLSNADLAHELGLEPSTIKNHVANVLSKLDLGSRPERRLAVEDRTRRSRQPSGLPRPRCSSSRKARVSAGSTALLQFARRSSEAACRARCSSSSNSACPTTASRPKPAALGDGSALWALAASEDSSGDVEQSILVAALAAVPAEPELV